jgi:hypothetical protein
MRNNGFNINNKNRNNHFLNDNKNNKNLHIIKSSSYIKQSTVIKKPHSNGLKMGVLRSILMQLYNVFVQLND